MVTRVYEAQAVSKVILRAAKADTARIEIDPQSTVVEVSGNPADGAKGYHPADPFWRETPAQDWGLDFVSARHGNVLIISTKNEIHYIHHRYFLRDLRMRVPRGIEVIRQVRELTGDGEPDLSPPEREKMVWIRGGKKKSPRSAPAAGLRIIRADQLGNPSAD
jgi:hypothetical protein